MSADFLFALLSTPPEHYGGRQFMGLKLTCPRGCPVPCGNSLCHPNRRHALNPTAEEPHRRPTYCSIGFEAWGDEDQQRR